MANKTPKKSALDMFSTMKKDKANFKTVKPENKGKREVASSKIEEKPEITPAMNEPVAEPTVSAPEEKESAAAIDLNFKKKPKVKKKDTHTFYFSNEIYDKLKEKADEQGANISEMLEYILTQVLK